MLIHRAVAAAAVAGLLLPAVAAADPPDCSRLMRQLIHYEGMVERAEDLGNDEWADKTQAHVELLEERLDNRCPSYSERRIAAEEAGRQLLGLMRLAAEGALKFFTFGAM